MINAFNKFIQEIKYQRKSSFENAKIVKAELDHNSNTFDLIFETLEMPNFEQMKDFIDHFENFRYKINFLFRPKVVLYDEAKIFPFLEYLICDKFQNPHLFRILKHSNIYFHKEGMIKIKFSGSHSYNEFYSIQKRLLDELKVFGFKKIIFDLAISSQSESVLQEEKNKIEQEASLSYQKYNTQPLSVPSFKSYGRRDYVDVPIHELRETEEERVKIIGRVFNKESRLTKNGYTVISFALTDFKDAVSIKFINKNKTQIDKINAIEEGQSIEVKGTYKFDTFDKENIVSLQSFRQKESKVPRYDEASKKRIELSIRTSMTTMDGFLSPIKFIERALQWGHKAIAINDVNSVQAFPEFFNSIKNKDIKPIYGASLVSMDKNHKFIQQAKTDEKLYDNTYVVFDLETTGLSPIFDELIEFGAVKIANGQIVDRKQFFIKPKKPIPGFITELTSITNEDVKDAIGEEEAIKQIKSYLDDYTLVAHNANFDIGFINQKLENHDLGSLSNPFIDTMQVARYLFPSMRNHRLETISKKGYDVVYESDTAHRADYDADVLAKVWLKMIEDLKEKEIFSQNDLEEIVSPEVYSRTFPYEFSTLAKNQKGLKTIFKLISNSHTKTLFRQPTTFFQDIDRENLLLGSGGIKSRLVDYIFTGTYKQIKEEISKYDYIEIQPMQSFAHKLDQLNQNDLEKIIMFVILEAKRQNKIVVATGDVRYLDLEEKLFHKVYINAKGLGGVRHYLFNYKNKNAVYPNQHFLTTNEMKEQLAFLKDDELIDEIVVDNTHLIASKIESEIEVIKSKLFTPKMDDANEKLERLVYESAKAKFGDKIPKLIQDRIERELKPIIKYGFGVIYYISYLLVDKSLKDGYLVGSRGSVGSSLVAHLANITEVNPLEPHYICPNCKFFELADESSYSSGYDLPEKRCPNCQTPLRGDGQNIPFETFLGFEANKLPDIDLNFSGDYQPIIHNEVKRIFGDTHAFRAGTISTVAEKTAYGYVKAWAEETNQDVSKAFVDFVAKNVSGSKRTSGQHPGGILVVPKEFEVEDFSPINFPANDKNSAWKTTHFDFHAIHDNILKLDLLGHDDPTAIKHLENLTGINAKEDIPFSDSKVLSLFSSPKSLGIKPENIDGETTGVMGIPEFGTSFVRRMLKTAKVKSFADLIAVSGLSHGTDVWTGNAELIVKTHGKGLNEVISCRDNIMIDLVNKGIDPLIAFNIMEKVRKGKGITADEKTLLIKFKVEDWYIDSLEKIKYMFPKAHATAYVMMAWRIAWFKVYYPQAYYAAYFTNRADVFDIKTIVQGQVSTLEKLKEYKKRRNFRGDEGLSNKEKELIPILELANEAFARGIKIGNIDMAKSQAHAWIIDKEQNILIPPFISLDGLGESVAKKIILAREEKDFVSIEDMKKRTGINKTTIQLMKDLRILDHLSETDQISLFSL